MRPDALYFRNAGRFELIPNGARAGWAAIEGVVVRRDSGNSAQEDRVVAMEQRLHPDGGLFLLATRIIPGPFTQRPFVDQIVGMNEALESNFGIGWNGQSRARTFDDFHRLAQKPARGVIFVLAVRD